MENINGKTILAIGAHVGDMELTAGALLASCAVSGGRAASTAVRGSLPVTSTSKISYRCRAKGTKVRETCPSSETVPW